MPTKIITAEAVIKGKDETGQAFQSVESRVENLKRKLGMFRRAADIKDQVAATTAALERQQRVLAAIEKTRQVEMRQDSAHVRYLEAVAKADKATAAFDTADRASQSKKLALMQQANAAAGKAEATWRRQLDAVGALKQGLESEGIAVRDLASAEARLRSGIEATSRAMLGQREALGQVSAAERRAAEYRGRIGRVAHPLLTSTLGTAAAMGGGYYVGHLIAKGIEDAAHEQLAYMYANLATGQDPTSAAGRRSTVRLQQTAEQTSIGTIYSRPEVAKMMPGIAGMADVPLDAALPFMPGAIRFAEVVRQFGAAIDKEFPAQESAAAAIRMSHMLGISDPDKMMPVLNMLVPAATTAEKSPDQLVKVLQYMTGSAAGVGMSNTEAINLGTLGSILMPGTRAGTSLNMMLTGLMPKAGPGAGTKVHRAAAQRLAEMEKAGFIDPKTRQLFRDKEGNVLGPLIEHLQRYLTLHPKTAYGDFTKWFEQRGARMAFELARNPKMAAMLAELEMREANFEKMGGVTRVQAKLNETPVNQYLRAKGNFDTAVTDFMTHSLPALTAALNRFNGFAEAARVYFGKNPDAWKSVAEGVGVAGAFGAGVGVYELKALIAAGPLLSRAAERQIVAGEMLIRAAERQMLPPGSVPGAPGSPGGPEGPGPKARGIGWARWLATLSVWGGLAADMYSHGVGTPSYDGKPLLKSFLGLPIPTREEQDNDWKTSPAHRVLDAFGFYGDSGGGRGAISPEAGHVFPYQHHLEPAPEYHLEVGGAISSEISRLAASLSEMAARKVDVTGKLDPVELKGAAQVNVSVAVKGPATVESTHASSSGNIKASVGTTMLDAIAGAGGVW